MFAAQCSPAPPSEDTSLFTPLFVPLCRCELLGKPFPLPRRPHLRRLLRIFDSTPVVWFPETSPLEDELSRLLYLSWRLQHQGVVIILSGRRALQHRPSREEHCHAGVQCCSVGFSASSCHWLHPRGVYAISRSGVCRTSGSSDALLASAKPIAANSLNCLAIPPSPGASVCSEAPASSACSEAPASSGASP